MDTFEGMTRCEVQGGIKERARHVAGHAAVWRAWNGIFHSVSIRGRNECVCNVRYGYGRRPPIRTGTILVSSSIAPDREWAVRRIIAGPLAVLGLKHWSRLKRDDISGCGKNDRDVVRKLLDHCCPQGSSDAWVNYVGETKDIMARYAQWIDALVLVLLDRRSMSGDQFNRLGS